MLATTALRVRFWGTRGSLPAPLSAPAVTRKIRAAVSATRGHSLQTEEDVDAFVENVLPFSVSKTFGGDSSCVQIDAGGQDYIVCDSGSGIRSFGNSVLAERGNAPQTYHLFMSHLHWDHIMGFPFFIPAYIPGNTIRIYSCHDDARNAFERQHGAPSFPVDFSALGATIEFVPLEAEKSYEIAGVSVRASKQRHGGDSYGYRFERDGRSVVYSTDSEYKVEATGRHPVVELFKRADLLIFDAMYSLADAASVKEDWGHSSNIMGVDLAHFAEVGHLVLFHHEPVHDDAALERILDETRRYEEMVRKHSPLVVSAAYDGLEISV